MPCIVRPLPTDSPSPSSSSAPSAQGFICTPLRWQAMTNCVENVQATASSALPLRDGPQNVYVPTTASEWTGLGLPAPNACWGCQETTGNLTPSIGAVSLDASETVLYNQSVTGWTRKFLGLDSAATGRGWLTSSSTLDVAQDESCAWIVYLSSAHNNFRDIMMVGGQANRVHTLTNNAYRFLSNGNAGTVNHGGLTNVHVIMWYRNFSNTTKGGMSDLENFTNDFPSFEVLSGAKGLGSDTNVSDIRFTMAAFWKGANAQTIAQKSTLQTLAWNVTW